VALLYRVKTQGCKLI